MEPPELLLRNLSSWNKRCSFARTVCYIAGMPGILILSFLALDLEEHLLIGFQDCSLEITMFSAK